MRPHGSCNAYRVRPHGSQGVGQFADTFMYAIEQIASATRTVVDAEGNRQFVKVWNPTVANLTLMALGSSVRSRDATSCLCAFCCFHRSPRVPEH
jgi:hypothetical protein